MSDRGASVRFGRVATVALVFFLLAGCEARYARRPVPERDINAVLRDHDRELLAIPGVVGVFVGVLPDGKTPCLKVMAEQKTAALLKNVPPQLEGYRVVVEETGAIHPLKARRP